MLMLTFIIILDIFIYIIYIKVIYMKGSYDKCTYRYLCSYVHIPMPQRRRTSCSMVNINIPIYKKVQIFMITKITVMFKI